MTLSDTSEPTGDRIDLIALAETMLTSRGSWDWDDMIEAAAYTAYRLHRRGVQTRDERGETVTLRTEDLVEQAWPYDGPHDVDSVTTAASAIADLSRYLANATWHPHALPYASTTYRILGGLNSAIYRQVQVLEQLREAAGRIAQDPALYDDRRDRPGSQTAAELTQHLDAARMLAGQLADALSTAHAIASHLGHEEAIRCARCGRGEPRQGQRFCEACIDRCHEATEFDHSCPVCAVAP